MEALVCPFCSGIVEVDDKSEFGKCKYCRRTFNIHNAEDMAAASDADKENVVKWRKELIDNLDIVERSQKRRDYSNVKHFALQILSVVPGDFSSRYFSALCDYKSGNDTPYVDFLKNGDISRAASEELELVGNKIIDHAEKKHEAAIKGFFVRAYGVNADIYVARAEKAIADYIAHLRLTGVRDCDIFVCHSSVDADEASKLVVALERDGLSCWLAERNLLPGTQNYEEELQSAVEHCRMLLFLSSANSIYSKECEKELRIANADGKLFFAVKLDNEPYFGISKNILSSVQWLNAFDGVTVHGGEIAAAVKMAFADDDEEKAELQRRALEARKRAAESAQTVKPVVMSAGGTDNAEVFLVQIKEGTKNYNVYSENKNKVNSLIDRGLELNPNNSELWYYKFLIGCLKYGGAAANGGAFKAELEKKFNETKLRLWDSVVNEYCDSIKEIPGDYEKTSVRANFSVDSEDGELRSQVFAEFLKIEPWQNGYENFDIEKYVETAVASKMPEVFENSYFKFAEEKASDADEERYRSAIANVKAVGEQTVKNAVGRYERLLRDEADNMIEARRNDLVELRRKYSFTLPQNNVAHVAQLGKEKAEQEKRLSDPSIEEQELRLAEKNRHDGKKCELNEQIESNKTKIDADKKILRKNRINNVLFFFVMPFVFVAQLICSSFVIFYGWAIVLIMTGSLEDFFGCHKKIFGKIWHWGIKWRSGKPQKVDIEKCTADIKKCESELEAEKKLYNTNLVAIVNDKQNRIARYKNRIAALESELQEADAVAAQYASACSDIRYNIDKFETLFNR